MHDDQLRHRFAELRDLESAGTPDFEAVLRRPLPRATSRQARQARHAVVTLLAVAAVAVLALVLRPRPVPDAPPHDITTWTAPTDALLPDPATGVLGIVPSLGASVIDQYIYPNTTGDD